MYRLAIYLYPDGHLQTVLQTEKGNRCNISGLAFFAQLEPELERFRKRVKQSLGDSPGPQGKTHVET